MMSKITPRDAYPHIKVVGDFIFVSGKSSRRADNTIAWVDMIDEMDAKVSKDRNSNRSITEYW